MPKAIYKGKNKVKLLDLYFPDTSYKLEERKAKLLCSKYPSRYRISTPEETNIMPAMPQEYKPLPNGIATLISASVETTESRYGLQETIACVVEHPEGFTNTVNVYIPHKSYKKVKEFEKAGVVLVSGDEWLVTVGAKFRVVVSDGKIISIMPPELELVQAAQSLPQS